LWFLLISSLLWLNIALATAYQEYSSADQVKKHGIAHMLIPINNLSKVV